MFFLSGTHTHTHTPHTQTHTQTNTNTNTHRHISLEWQQAKSEGKHVSSRSETLNNVRDMQHACFTLKVRIWFSFCRPAIWNITLRWRTRISPPAKHNQTNPSANTRLGFSVWAQFACTQRFWHCVLCQLSPTRVTDPLTCHVGSRHPTPQGCETDSGGLWSSPGS